MVKHLRTGAKEVTNNERLNDLVHQKIVSGKTSFQKEMLEEKLLCYKCPFRVSRTSDESFWKVS